MADEGHVPGERVHRRPGLLAPRQRRAEIMPAAQPISSAEPLYQRVNRPRMIAGKDLHHPDAAEQLQVEREFGRHEEDHQQRADLDDQRTSLATTDSSRGVISDGRTASRCCG